MEIEAPIWWLLGTEDQVLYWAVPPACTLVSLADVLHCLLPPTSFTCQWDSECLVLWSWRGWSPRLISLFKLCAAFFLMAYPSWDPSYSVEVDTGKQGNLQHVLQTSGRPDSLGPCLLLFIDVSEGFGLCFLFVVSLNLKFLVAIQMFPFEKMSICCSFFTFL